MKLTRLFLAIGLTLLASLGLWSMQRGSRYDQSEMGEREQPSEFYFSRLKFTSFGFRGFREAWRQDWPRADNDCLVVIRRLTRINAPAPLNVVDLESDRLLEYPWIYAVGVNTWSFTDAEATRLHDYLMRGGFLMVDHFHGEDDWSRFMAGMLQVLPDATVEDLPDDDPIYHVLFSIDEKFQIPGEVYVATGRTYEKDGYTPRWRAIRDSKGRVMVAICANMHLGDAWEWARTRASILKSFQDSRFVW